MSNPEKPYVIVVGVDYSPSSDLALERAFELGAERPQAEVHVVNVVRLYGSQAMVDATAEPSGFAAMSLSEATAQLGTYVDTRWSAFLAKGGKQHPTGAGRVVSHLRLEAPAEELAQIAGDLEADLVVVGTHGRTGIARLLLGSIAESVVKLAPCPVLVVREKPHADDAPHIEPPCPTCVETRRATKGEQFWCEEHREKHGQRRHTYHQGDRAGAETEMPLTYHN